MSNVAQLKLLQLRDAHTQCEKTTTDVTYSYIRLVIYSLSTIATDAGACCECISRNVNRNGNISTYSCCCHKQIAALLNTIPHKAIEMRLKYNCIICIYHRQCQRK